jgi:hypothetical protein
LRASFALSLIRRQLTSEKTCAMGMAKHQSWSSAKRLAFVSEDKRARKVMKAVGASRCCLCAGGRRTWRLSPLSPIRQTPAKVVVVKMCPLWIERRRIGAEKLTYRTQMHDMRYNSFETPLDIRHHFKALVNLRASLPLSLFGGTLKSNSRCPPHI